MVLFWWVVRLVVVLFFPLGGLIGRIGLVKGTDSGWETHLQIPSERVHDLIRANIVIGKDVLAMSESLQGLS